MTAKSEQLQIRVTPRQKAALKRLAAAAGQDVSAYVLSRALPEKRLEFASLLRSLEDEAERRYALAELSDFLTGLAPFEMSDALTAPRIERLTPFVQNYVSAMVEQAATDKGVTPPAWAAAVEPLAEPYFATELGNLRLHLLRASPAAFKRRNLFIDSALGARV